MLVFKGEVPQWLVIIGAKFEIGVLNQIVDQGRIWTPPATDTPVDYTCNQRLKPAYKFSPASFVLRVETIRHQLLRRQLSRVHSRSALNSNLLRLKGNNFFAIKVHLSSDFNAFSRKLLRST